MKPIAPEASTGVVVSTVLGTSAGTGPDPADGAVSPAPCQSLPPSASCQFDPVAALNRLNASINRTWFLAGCSNRDTYRKNGRSSPHRVAASALASAAFPGRNRS